MRRVGTFAARCAAGWLVAAVACLPAVASEQLQVLCSASAEWCDFVGSTFANASAQAVRVQKVSSGEALSLLMAQADKPQFDVWYGGTGDPHMQAAELGLTEPYRSKHLAELREWAQAQARQSGWRTVGLYTGPLGIVYHREQLARLNLPAPRCWSDLLQPALRGKVVLANPATSGTAYTMLATLVQLMGETAAFDYLKALHRNVAEYKRSGAAPLKAVSAGEAAVGVAFLHDVPAAQIDGAPLTAVPPCEGTGAEVGSMSLVHGGANPQAARAFYEWALQPLTQQFAGVLRQYQIPSHRAVLLDSKMPDVHRMKLIDYDYARYGNANERSRLIARWQHDVSGATSTSTTR